MIAKMMTAKEARQASDTAYVDIDDHFAQAMLAVSARANAGASSTFYSIPTRRLDAAMKSKLAARLNKTGFSTSFHSLGTATMLGIYW